jgi:hypothetical protein
MNFKINIIYVGNVMVITITIFNDTTKVIRGIGENWESYDRKIQGLIKLFMIKYLDEQWNQILEKDEFIPLDELLYIKIDLKL